MKRDNKAIKIITVLPAIALLAATAFASDWEMRIKAETASRASNSLSFGQKTDATDGFDGQYEVPAYISGDISAYFSHSDWGQETDKYWRDIKGSGESKSWGIKVEAGTTGQTVALSWDKSKIPTGYTATLTDAATNEKTDMTASNSYAYTHTGTREFSIETAEQQENLYAVSGRVSDSRGKGASGVTLSISTNPSSTTTTDAYGNYSFSGVAAGTYTVTPSKGRGYSFSPREKSVTVTSGDSTGNNFTLNRKR